LFLSVSFGSVPAAAQSYAYVPTHKSNSVSVINTSTRSVIALVPVGIQPLQAAISPDGAFTFVTDSGWFYPNNDVSVINTATNTLPTTVRGLQPCQKVWPSSRNKGIPRNKAGQLPVVTDRT
jgi:YVTN family beta-propeller protein